MTATYDIHAPVKVNAAGLPYSVIQGAALWLFIASSWFVFIEPAPYEILFVLAFILFLPGGMLVSRILVPLIVFLILYNIGGAMSLVQVAHLPKTVQFTAISIYMAATAIFFACAVLRNPVRNMSIIQNAYIFAAVPASVLGLVGYFDIAGLAEMLAPLGRAQGTFKDPNVFSTFLVLPAAILIHGLATGILRWRAVSFLALVIILAAIFMAFSRGAWMNLIASVILIFMLSFVVSTSLRLRSRLVLSAIAGGILAVALMTFALSFPEIREFFFERASLIQSYDGGERGRFGNQLRSLSLLIQSPNGLGPYGFARTLGQDPHNVYINAFSAYGWLGGLSYLVLILATIAACWRAVFANSPYRNFAIPAVSVLIATILQGIQIDTDHWRHFYLLLGIVWGLCAATYLPQHNESPVR